MLKDVSAKSWEVQPFSTRPSPRSREHASRAFEIFLTSYNPKYPKAADCLAKRVESRWLRLRGTEQITKPKPGVQFKIGVETKKETRQEITA